MKPSQPILKLPDKNTDPAAVERWDAFVNEIGRVLKPGSSLKRIRGALVLRRRIPRKGIIVTIYIPEEKNLQGLHTELGI